MEIIDAHQHFWYYSPDTHGWIDDAMEVIRRDFLPVHLQGLLQEQGVDGTIAVQVDQSISETHFLLDQADEFDFILGVVGWVDLRSNHLEKQLDALAHRNKLVGFRHIVQAEPDPFYLLRPEFRRGLEIIFERGYTYDILVYPHQLPAVLELVDLFSQAPMVIDHIAKPYIRTGYYKAWEILIREIAQYPNMHCKWSGMITEANWVAWKPEDISRYLDITTECFTADRLMFGSDWPVLNVAGTYDQVQSLITDYITGWDEGDQQKVMAKTARGFYLSGMES